MLTTRSELPFVSPLAGLADGPVGPETAQLWDWSGRRLLDVRGRERPEALQKSAAPEAIGEAACVQNGVWMRLRADRWFYVALSASDGAEIEEPALTDVTHAYAILLLRGVHIPGVLAQLCALDFDNRAFPDHRVAQTSLAKVPALIVRLDAEVQGYLILVERSVAAYVWEVIAGTLTSAA